MFCNNKYNKIKGLILFCNCLFVSQVAYSMTCPDLEKAPPNFREWTIYGDITTKPTFQKVALASSGVGCGYTHNVMLIQNNGHYLPDEPNKPYWQKSGTDLFNYSFYCTESRETCSFHK